MQQRQRYKSGPIQFKRRDVEEEEELYGDAQYDDAWPPRMPNSTRRYPVMADVKSEVGRARADVQTLASQKTYHAKRADGMTTVPPRRSATRVDMPAMQSAQYRAPHTDEVEIAQRDEMQKRGGGSGSQLHWLVYVGVAMFIMLLGWVLLTMVANWWQVTQDDWHYGRPRTYQTDMVVGHADSTASPSHFIALNVNRHVEIIEFPGGDASKAKIYVGPTLVGAGQDLAVVTLSFKDVNGDGKLDMIVNVEDSHFVFINDGGQFRPARPGENVQL